MANVDVDILKRIYEVVGHKYEGVYEIGSKLKDAIVEEEAIESILEDLLSVVEEKEEEIKELERDRKEEHLWEQADDYNEDVKLGIR